MVDPSSARIILDGVSSSSTREVALPDSYHVATLDHDAPLIASQTHGFLTEHVGAPHGQVSHEL